MKELIQLIRKDNEKLYVLATGKKVRSLEKTGIYLIHLQSLEKQEIKKELSSISEDSPRMNSYEIGPCIMEKLEDDYFFVKLHKIKDKYVKKALKCESREETELNF